MQQITAHAQDTAPAADTAASKDTRATGSSLSPDFINFGYIQNAKVAPYLQYEALTHIAPPFADFNASGDLINTLSFSNRDVNLKTNGSAHRAGTKIILCVRNQNFSESVLDTVMQNPTLRNNLAARVAATVQNDGYCHGVNFDFELLWGAQTRDGITAFIQQVRNLLPAPYEISIYIHATYNSTRWNIPALLPNVDYFLYSTYEWSGASNVRASSDFDSCLPNIYLYLNDGIPPEKFVLTWAQYGKRWNGVTSYGQNTGSGRFSQGFYEGLYNTTLRQANGGPFTSNYVQGDEIGWHTHSFDGQSRVTTHETPESVSYKISSALNFPGYNGSYAGVRLRGVAWWSLMWVSNYYPMDAVSGTPGNFFESFDPIANQQVSRPPYYRHIDLLAQELLKPPGQKQFVLESFENDNDHWRDPNESPDTIGDTDKDSYFARAYPTPDLSQKRYGSLYFDFEVASDSRAFLRHEMVNHPTETHITDTNARLALISKNSRIRGKYRVLGNYSGRRLRLALVDGLRQVEVSNPIALPSASGWYDFTWDINNPAQVNGFDTNEPSLLDGNGVVDTQYPGSRDISFYGFMVEGGPAGSGSIYFDNITYESVAPDDLNYIINEVRYLTDSSEFVEISGPPGPFPSDMSVIIYNGTDGSEYKTTPLGSYSMPASGLFVLGDPGVANANGSTGTNANWTSGNDLPSHTAAGVQLYGTASGYVYDSVVYKAFGGIQNLSRSSTRGVTSEGYGWFGETGSGTNSNGQAISFGRMNNVDTHRNQVDFSMMSPTPGSPNGSTFVPGTPINFSSIPPELIQSYNTPRIANPATGGIPASTAGDTSAYRCVDTNGGGTIGFLGDALLGSETGLEVTGKLYIPAGSHQAQALGIGICGTQGSAFFNSSPVNNGYEDGYWLLYEHGTADLNDGLPARTGQFEFIMASNDKTDSVPATALGTRRGLAQLAATQNSWVNFLLRIDPTAASGQRLVVQVNGTDVYRGDIPAGGRSTGSVMIGHRETNGSVATHEGTWVDDLLVAPANPAARVDDFMLY